MNTDREWIIEETVPDSDSLYWGNLFSFIEHFPTYLYAELIRHRLWENHPLRFRGEKYVNFTILATYPVSLIFGVCMHVLINIIIVTQAWVDLSFQCWRWWFSYNMSHIDAIWQDSMHKPTLSKRNHLMDVDIPYQTGSGGRGTPNWPFYV